MYILVVDDNRTRAKDIARALRSKCDEHVEVVTVENGNDALFIIAQNPIEELKAVVTNFGLPGMTGDELAENIAQQWPDADPVLVLWTKNIVPEVVSDRFDLIRRKNPDLADFAGAISVTLLAHR